MDVNIATEFTGIKNMLEFTCLKRTFQNTFSVIHFLQWKIRKWRLFKVLMARFKRSCTIICLGRPYSVILRLSSGNSCFLYWKDWRSMLLPTVFAVQRLLEAVSIPVYQWHQGVSLGIRIYLTAKFQQMPLIFWPIINSQNKYWAQLDARTGRAHSI